MREHSDINKPTTQQRNLAKLPRALAPLIERPQWCVWRWTLQENGRWQKPPYQALDPQRHASTKDPDTWCDYATALAAMQAGKAVGISYVLTAEDPFAAIDLDHCRHAGTHSIDKWAQNFLDVCRHTYSEVTPSGEGCRIWGLTADDSGPINRKFTLDIDGKQIAAELFRRAPKALTITGYTLDHAIRELTNIDKGFQWAAVWGERRKAAAEATEQKIINGCGFNGSGAGYDVEQIEWIAREGVTDGANRSDTFHAVVGHYLGCGWNIERIDEHLRQFPDGIAGRYLREGRLFREITRSAGKYEARSLPLAEGWTAPETAPPPPPRDPDSRLEMPSVPDLDPHVGDPDDVIPDPELDELPARNPDVASVTPDPNDDPELEDPELEEDDSDEDDEPAQQDSKLPRLYSHGDADSRPLKAWLIKKLIPAVGHGLLSGQWGAGKTFVVFDLAAALGTGQPFLGHPVKRQCGVLLIAAEGASEVRLRLDAVVRHKCGSTERVPFRWYEATPLLLAKGAAETLIAMARQADESLQAEFGLPLGLIVIDTIASCAGYPRVGDENDSAAAQAVMNVLKAVAQALGCFVLGVDHFGKNQESGTRGSGAKESASDLVLACLGDKELNGCVTNTRVAVRKHRGGQQGQEHPFTLRVVEAPEPDEDGEAVTTMVVDWQPAGAVAGAQARPEPDPWLEGCRQDEQRAKMSRLKQVLHTTLAAHGTEQPVPAVASDETGRRNSPPYLGNEFRRPVSSGPMVRMVDQETVREAFYLCTPGDPRQTQLSRFNSARDRAEYLGRIGIGNIDGITYLWLTRPDREGDEPC
jgi:AAA domain